MEKKRVLYFIPEFPRLTETFIEREISKLIEFDTLDITVLSLQKATGSTSENVISHLVYKQPTFLNFLFGVFSYGIFCPKKAIQGFRLILAKKDKIGLLKRIYLYMKSFAYTHLFSTFNPDFLYIHFLSWSSTIGMLVAYFLDLPYGISAHAKDVMTEGSLIPAKVRTAKFISICNKFAYQSCIDQAGIQDPKNVYLQYHGVDESKFSNLPEVTKSDKPFIFAGSRLVEKKGLPYLIEAAKILKDRGVSFLLYIVGPGSMYQELVGQIQQLSLQDDVFVYGKGKGAPWDKILEFFAKADIFTHPSINVENGDADGIPNFIVEAAFLKIPVVTTDAGAIADFITNEKEGLVVAQRSSQELANALERLIKDPDLGKRLGVQAYQKAKQMFDIDKNVKEIENLILESV